SSRPRSVLGAWAATWVGSEMACRVCGRSGVAGETWRSWWRVIVPESQGPNQPTRSANQDKQVCIRTANSLPTTRKAKHQRRDESTVVSCRRLRLLSKFQHLTLVQSDDRHAHRIGSFVGNTHAINGFGPDLARAQSGSGGSVRNAAELPPDGLGFRLLTTPPISSPGPLPRSPSKTSLRWMGRSDGASTPSLA